MSKKSKSYPQTLIKNLKRKISNLEQYEPLYERLRVRLSRCEYEKEFNLLKMRQRIEILTKQPREKHFQASRNLDAALFLAKKGNIQELLDFLETLQCTK